MNEIATVMGGAGKTKTDDLLKKCVKIATFIPKGGSGKTTTNGNLGWELSKYGRVLIVDCDHQGNITSWLYDEKRCSPFVNDLGDYFYEKAPLKDCIVNVRRITSYNVCYTKLLRLVNDCTAATLIGEVVE